MNTRNWILAGASALTCVAASVLVACGGGSGGSGSSGVNATQSYAASGTITAFGSVFVNGVEYDTSKAQVVDGDGDTTSATTANLQVGMNADVDATGTAASSVTFSSAVRGEIDSIDAAGNTLTVLGQPVLVTSATSFSGTVTSGASSVDLSTAANPLSNLSAGGYVIVHGFVECTSTGTACTSTQIVANLIIAPATGGSYRTGGYVQNLATSTGSTPVTSFSINGLTVDLGATTACGAAGATPTVAACSGLANGQYVVVRAPAASPPTVTAAAPTLTPAVIRLNAQSPALATGSTVTLEGPASQISTTANTFTVRGVTINASTLASTVATLTGARNQIVEVTGTVNADGSITATGITIEQHADLEVTAPLDAANLSSTSLSVLGETFTVDASTRFEDRSGKNAPGTAFNLTNFNTVLSAGDQLVVSGYPVTTTTASGTTTSLTATKVVRIKTPATAIVGFKGVLVSDSASTSTLAIAGGFSATLGSGTQLVTPGNASASTLATFFSTLTTDLASTTSPAPVVAVIGTASGTAGAVDATAGKALLFAGFNLSGGNWAMPH